MQLFHVNGHLTERLHRVRVEEYAVLFGYLAYLLDGLYRAYLVVCKHHGNKDGLIRYRLLHVRGIYKAVFVHIEIRHLYALLFQMRAGVQYRVMLYLGGYYVVALGCVCFGGRL